jgi:hypothetical protein
MTKSQRPARRRSQLLQDEAEPLYPNYLRGYGNQPLKKPRALRGSKLGPANQGRSLSPDEVAAVAAKLKQEGKL